MEQVHTTMREFYPFLCRVLHFLLLALVLSTSTICGVCGDNVFDHVSLKTKNVRSVHNSFDLQDCPSYGPKWSSELQEKCPPAGSACTCTDAVALLNEGIISCDDNCPNNCPACDACLGLACSSTISILSSFDLQKCYKYRFQWALEHLVSCGLGHCNCKSANQLFDDGTVSCNDECPDKCTICNTCFEDRCFSDVTSSMPSSTPSSIPSVLPSDPPSSSQLPSIMPSIPPSLFLSPMPSNGSSKSRSSSRKGVSNKSSSSSSRGKGSKSSNRTPISSSSSRRKRSSSAKDDSKTKTSSRYKKLLI